MFKSISRLRYVLAGWLFATCLIPLSVACGQFPQILAVETWPMEPFGVGKITFRLGPPDRVVQNTGAILLSERDGRVLYPAFSDGLIQQISDQEMAGGVHFVWFLFRGSEQLTVSLRASDVATFPIDLGAEQPALAGVMIQNWWRQFNVQARRRTSSGEYPPLVETYLTSMLGQRFGLPDPLPYMPADDEDSELQQTLNLLFDVESLRADAIRSLMTDPPAVNIESLPLCPPVEWASDSRWIAAPEVETEPIVRFVPEECFYLRFGDWNNQLWLKRLMGEYGGDLSRMIALRGHRGGTSEKMLEQLALESSQLDDWFGGNLIEDVAAIGTDFYVEDGPSNAILMLAKNGTLESQMSGRRSRFARQNADQGVTLTELEIAGHNVSLLSTPDNRIRSFYAVKDLCHITSSSSRIVERFLEAADGQRSLADHPEFRMARTAMPLERDDTIFIYLSRPFFENLLCPHYQVELMRRSRSLANIQLLQMAQWAAANEGFAQDDLDQMIQLGFLPASFNQLPDGSACNWVDDHWEDSVRGRRGYFVPIADVNVDSMTESEARWLVGRQDFYRNELKQVDPVLMACKRYQLDDAMERVVFDARVAPFGRQKYGWLGQMLGPALPNEVTAGPDDLIHFELSAGNIPLLRNSRPFQLFGALHGDVPPKHSLRATSFLEWMQLLRNTPGYIGMWPDPGYLDMFPALGRAPDAAGYTYSRILGLWRLRQGDVSLLSFDRDRLERARQEIAIVPAEQPAQVRLQVGDIASSNLRSWANALYYDRGWQTSIANTRFLNLIIQQFNVPPETALAYAGQLLAVDLVCPLQGEYQYISSDASISPLWQSTAWPAFDNLVVPADYSAPPMDWFRGLSLDIYQLETQFVVHGSLDIARDPNKIGSGAGETLGNLPSFDLFQGFPAIGELGAGDANENPADNERVGAGQKK